MELKKKRDGLNDSAFWAKINKIASAINDVRGLPTKLYNGEMNTEIGAAFNDNQVGVPNFKKENQMYVFVLDGQN